MVCGHDPIDPPAQKPDNDVTGGLASNSKEEGLQEGHHSKNNVQDSRILKISSIFLAFVGFLLKFSKIFRFPKT